MRKNILEIYGLAVCFVAIIFVIVNMAEGVYNIIRMAKPELTLSGYEFERHQSNDRYKGRWKKEEEMPSEDEITRLRTENYKIVVLGEGREGLQELIKNSVYLFLGLILLWIHWRISRSARESAG